ncbi:NUDIX hydrolase [Chengkuizengella axinellae]|uniref:NUDIX domain-containing protein n=1 Tax=Chengkuizengella axinellae TaxID=3064388 RepID=A0ABT9IUR9_9BACL|nr:NUDIX domain-containing protein [Chengkuizengella sp. 2205SS18-9]MDP5273078.1 NUDIX domain-containing protein [Chengkuizengella sp. 2205SS18-9]
MKKEISAGGVVYKYVDGQLLIQMIQDRFGKTTLAKGKMEPGETIEQTALREIEEETGIIGTISEAEPLEIVNYQYEHARIGIVNKEVHYFLIKAKEGLLQAQVEEITGVEWLPPQEAWKQQVHSGYDNNNSVLQKALIKLGYEI